MEQTQTKRRFSWLKLALVVSVVLNFVALGMVWGLVTRTGPSGSLLRASVAALPADDRRVFRQELREVWRAAGTAEHDARGRTVGAPRRMLAALEAEEFDADAFSAALRQAQARLVGISDQMHVQLVATLSAMTPDERRAYAQALEAQFSKRRWRAESRSAGGN